MSRQRWFCIVWALTLVWMPFGACAQELQEVDQAYIARLIDDLRSSSFAAALARRMPWLKSATPLSRRLRILLNRDQDRMEKRKPSMCWGRIGTEASIRAMLSGAVIQIRISQCHRHCRKNLDPEQAKTAAPSLPVPDQRSSRGKGHSCPGSAGDGNIQGGLGGGLG